MYHLATKYFDFEFDDIALPHPSHLCLLSRGLRLDPVPASCQMQKYIQQGGDVNKQNKLGDTPMHEVRT